MTALDSNLRYVEEIGFLLKRGDYFNNVLLHFLRIVVGFELFNCQILIPAIWDRLIFLSKSWRG